MCEVIQMFWIAAKLLDSLLGKSIRHGVVSNELLGSDAARAVVYDVAKAPTNLQGSSPLGRRRAMQMRKRAETTASRS